jgi:predicted lipoprotein with Yx(FWY)xxD motif
VVSSLSTTGYGRVLVVGSHGPYAGYSLYLFSGDAGGKFGCGTKVALGFDVPDANISSQPCTGPAGANPGADWPALTTAGKPVAGPGVDPALLGTVNRPGVGTQVTYGGHPLYMFDPPTSNFTPVGEGYLETVSPLFPWHGIWWLVSARGGQPAPGPATIGTEVLPDKKTVLAAGELSELAPTNVTVYSFSGDSPGHSSCTGACAVEWIPVLTQGPPQVADGVALQDISTVQRADGTDQVTYKGKPLYLYSLEKFIFPTVGAPPLTTGTSGDGNGLHGPSGGTFSVVPPAP